MPIVYAINENKEFSSRREYNQEDVEKSYWTISIYMTDQENSLHFVKEEENVTELSRYGPFKTLQDAKSALHVFADQIDEPVQYGVSQFGATVVFEQHPILLLGQRNQKVNHYNMASL